MGRIEIYHDSIGNMLEQIVEGQSLHSFAVIPEFVIDEQWKPMEGFKGEDRRFETGCDGVEREFLVLSFVDDGHDWIIVTTKCKHPNGETGRSMRRSIPRSLTASAARYRGNLGNRNDELKYDVAYWTHKEDFYVSGMNWTKLDLRAGVVHKGFYLDPQTVFAKQMAESGATLSDNYFGTYIQAGLYTFDAPYFPTRGISLSARGDYDFISPSQPAFTPVLTSRFDLKAAIPVGDRATFLPDLRLRGISHFGEKDHDGLIHTNFVGGRLAGRYTEDQIPFFGFDHVLAMSDQLASFTAEMRFNPVGNLYLSALAGVISADDKLIELLKHPLPDLFGFGAEAAYNTIVGPIRLSLHWSNAFRWGAHLSLGFDF